MRWVGFCHGCQRDDVEVEPRSDRHEKTLCDRCAEHRPVLLKTSPIYGNDTLTTPPRPRPETLPLQGNETRTRTRTRDYQQVRRTREEPQAAETPAETAEVDELLSDYETGKIAPAPIRLRELPPGATAALEKVRADFMLVAGLRLAVDDPRPVPYGCEWVAERVKLSKPHVARILKELVALGVIRYVGNMPGRGKGGEGTRLYEPCYAA
jgi:hypothetical protein